jgi:hypothetical protein
MVDFARYLTSKRSVDDRALNRRVWERLRTEIGNAGGERLRVVDVGAGVATGAERMWRWELFPPSTKIRYIAVEPCRELLVEARRRLESLPLPFETDFLESTLAAFAEDREHQGRFDVVVAHALVDVLDLSSSLDALVRLARPGGLLYIPIAFDGETSFEPSRDEDGVVLSAYHAAMNEPGPGSARTGRRLFHALRRRSVDVLEIGSSDWIVHPAGEGYPEDEAFFLRFILKTIEGAVAGGVDRDVLGGWMEARSGEIDEADLVYTAHQVDVLGRKRA